MSIDFENNIIKTENISEIQQITKFLERADIISFQNEIKSKNGNILVQADRPLTENFLKNLLLRTDIANDCFNIKITDNLKAALTNAISKQFSTRMDLSDYSFCAYLINKKDIDFTRIIKTSLNNEPFFALVTNIFLSHYPIIDHLIEVTLMGLGLLNNIKNISLENIDLSRYFQAGMLHDYSLMEKANWETEDSFTENTEHDKDSAIQLSGKNLPKEIAEIILTHNKLITQDIDEDKWHSNKTELLSIILRLCEYFTFINRTSKKEDGDLTEIIYKISFVAEKGNFPNSLINMFSEFFHKYTPIFNYGKKIASVENMCVHENLAYAYPKPKSTQLLCINNNIPCEHRLSSQPLKIVSDTNIHNDLKTLKSGWYYKCLFSDQLPVPPEKL